MLRRICSVAICFIILGFSFNAHALRCNNKVISIGTHTHQVEKLCGAPAQKLNCTEERRIENEQGKIEIVKGPICERWIYNFGPNRLQTDLTFIDGRLDNEKSGARYGY